MITKALSQRLQIFRIRRQEYKTQKKIILRLWFSVYRMNMNVPTAATMKAESQLRDFAVGRRI